jgi:predicted anti-sigma-YlaC factor YlaD
MTPGCVEFRQALGVYVVGAIDPAERAFVDRHLAGCGECRDELAGLAGLPALLGRVTLAEVERGLADAAYAPEPPERLLNSMLAETARRQRARKRRSALLAVAASVVLLAGVGAGVDELVGRPPAVTHSAAAPDWETVSHTNTATHVSAEVKYVQRAWGTETKVWVSGVRYGTSCDLWATDAAGQHTLVGSWSYKDEHDWYPGSAAVTAASITSFQITAGGKTLVSVPAT